MGKIYRDTYRVPFYASDVKGQMSLPFLLSVLLDLSAKQSKSLNMSDTFLFEKHHLVWIVTEYQLTMARLPLLDEEVLLETEALSYNKWFCYRRFSVKDLEGNELVTITATFALLDFTKRQLKPVPDELVSVYGAKKSKERLRSPKFPDWEVEESLSLQVAYFDLDPNGHVNNSKYLEWLYSGLDLDFLKTHVPESLVIRFSKEVHYGQDIQVEYTLSELVSYHRIKGEDGVYTQAKIEWRKE